MSKPQTAILIFARTTSTEAAHKLWFGKQKSNENNKLAKALLQQTIEKVQAIHLSYFIIDSTNQVNGSFGTKITTAIEQIFLKGFSSIVTIGTDCPTLTTKDIESAALQLQENEMVIGPDKRGGIYLWGIQQKTFNKKLHSSLLWKTSSLFKSIKDVVSTDGLVASYMAVKNDFHSTINKISKKVLSLILSISTFTLIIHILRCIKEFFKEELLVAYLVAIGCKGLRAPPHVA